MSSKPKKRSRATVEDRRADCPFVATTVPTPAPRDEKSHKAAKRRKGDNGGGGGGGGEKPFFQISPFEPAGTFRSRETMDTHYHINERKKWTEMTKYMSFVLSGTKYYSDQFIFVANDDALERQKSGKLHKQQIGPGDFWVARILEIRASDEHHVYARVFWMYTPDELPAATVSGKKTAAGRQPHHGINELIASNHMDIINVMSVVQHARVNQWIESDDETQDAMYWRQALECQTMQLSSIDLVCRCQMPANPDKTLVGCTNGDCGKWMHLECLREDVLKRVYDRLGTDRPHIPEPPAIKKEEEDAVKRESPQEPLSPPRVEDEQPQATIAVLGDAVTDAVVKQADEDTPKPTGPTPPTAQSPPPERPPDNRSLVRKKPAKRRLPSSQHWLGSFDADLRMNNGPMVWEVKDLRQDVTRGSKTWTEPAICLLCNHTIE